MDIDAQSEDGELRKSPTKELEDLSLSDEDEVDTADSLDIKPPQATIRHGNKTSSSRRRVEKHSDRRDRGRDEKEKRPRLHYDRLEDRHRDKHRHRRHDFEPLERSESGKREQLAPHRDRSEAGHVRESRHDRKDRSTGDRVLEDLRESDKKSVHTRLLDKRRERREDPREVRESRRVIRESRESRREVRIEESSRDRREVRVVMEETRSSRIVEERSSGRHVRSEEFAQLEIIDRPEKEKRRKRSHKHERSRDRDVRQKLEKEQVARDKHYSEVMEIGTEEESEMESIPMVEPKEMTEQELRREKLLEADREMARRKEVSRLELEQRRLKSGKKRLASPSQDPSIVDVSDDSESLKSDDEKYKSESRHTTDERQSNRGRSSDGRSSDSSGSSSEDDEDDESGGSAKNSDAESNDEGSNDYGNTSPISVERLAKSDHSDGDSPGHVDVNGTEKIIEEKEEKKKLTPELPPYNPAIQGCRDVEEFKCLNRIEEGTYGIVYRAEDRRTKEIVALKRLKMEKEKEGFPITSLREINTLLKAQHENIVTVREIVVGSNMDRIFIVMDYVEHDLKSLMEFMKQKNQFFNASEVKCLLKQLLKAVAHLHDNWILHRDLKTSNLLLSHKGILKVGDFGLAREYGSPLRQYTPVVVTLWYRAPELLLGGKEYSTHIDMWSVGCIFAEFVRMEALFPGKSETEQLNRIFKELGTPNDVIWPGYSKLPMVQKIPFAHYPVNNLRQRFEQPTENCLDLCNKFLTYNPANRITAEEALKHKYFDEPPKATEPGMFPTWPAKSELDAPTSRISRAANASPKPPSGGKEYNQLDDGDEGDLNSAGFHMGGTGEARKSAQGGGFHLKF